MLILKFCEVIDVLVDDDVEVVRLVVRCDVAGSKCLSHCAGAVLQSALVLFPLSRNNGLSVYENEK